MKNFFITAIFTLIGLLAFAQERIAVFPFEIRNNVLTADEAVFLYRQFSNEFSNRNSGRFTVIPRLNVDRLINTEAAFQLSDFSAQEKTAEMNRVLNGTQILSGLIGRVNNRITISVSLYTYPDLRQLPGGVDLSVANTQELFSRIPELVRQMQAGISEGGSGPTGRTYNIGDIGPAGGIIFYDKGVSSNGWRYLEVAPVETEVNGDLGSTEEGYRGMGIENVYRFPDGGIGNGKYKTEFILAHFERNNMLSDGVLLYCKYFSFGGYNDWFLPNSDELDLIYLNLKLRGIGEFSNHFYWSSTHGWNDNLFRVQRFADGEIDFCNGNNSYLLGPWLRVQVFARFVRQF